LHRGPSFSKLIKVLNLEHFKVIILKHRSPARIKIFLSVTSIFRIKGGFIRRIVLFVFFCPFCSPFCISFYFVTILFKIRPIIFYFFKIRVVAELLSKKLILLLLESLIFIKLSFGSCIIIPVVLIILSILLPTIARLIWFLLGGLPIGILVLGLISWFSTVKIAFWVKVMLASVIICFRFLVKCRVKLIEIVTTRKITVKVFRLFASFGFRLTLPVIIALEWLRLRLVSCIVFLRLIILFTHRLVANNFPSRRNLLEFFSTCITNFVRMVFVGQLIVCFLDWLGVCGLAHTKHFV